MSVARHWASNIKKQTFAKLPVTPLLREAGLLTTSEKYFSHCCLKVAAVFWPHRKYSVLPSSKWSRWCWCDFTKLPTGPKFPHSSAQGARHKFSLLLRYFCLPQNVSALPTGCVTIPVTRVSDVNCKTCAILFTNVTSPTLQKEVRCSLLGLNPQYVCVTVGASLVTLWKVSSIHLVQKTYALFSAGARVS